MKYDLARFGLPGSSVGVNVNNLFDREYVSSCYSEYACYWGARTSGRRHRHLPFLTTYGRGSPRPLSGYRHQEHSARRTPSRWIRVTFRVPGRTSPLSCSRSPSRPEVTGLIGHNGSGKSTLLKTLGRHQPSAGEVLLDGQPLESWGSKAFARKSGLSAVQLPPAEGIRCASWRRFGRYPWHGALGRFGAADREKVEEAIALVGLKPLAHRLVDSLSRR